MGTRAKRPVLYHSHCGFCFRCLHLEGDSVNGRCRSPCAGNRIFCLRTVVPTSPTLFPFISLIGNGQNAGRVSIRLYTSKTRLFQPRKGRIQILGDNAILLRPEIWHGYRPRPETGCVNAHCLSERPVFKVRASAGIHENGDVNPRCGRANADLIWKNLVPKTGF